VLGAFPDQVGLGNHAAAAACMSTTGTRRIWFASMMRQHVAHRSARALPLCHGAASDIPVGDHAHGLMIAIDHRDFPAVVP
jgi:hypothetical protein